MNAAVRDLQTLFDVGSLVGLSDGDESEGVLFVFAGW